MSVSLEPLRILIVRLSAIGDVVHGLPVLNALRDYYPRGRISWLVEGRAGDLLEGHASLNQIIRLKKGWLSSPREVARLRCDLFQQRFDVTIDLQGLTKSAVAARLSGARRRIGFAGAEGRELSQWLNNERIAATAEHVIDKNLQLLSALGIHHPAVAFRIPSNAAANSRVQDFLRHHELLTGYALLNPGAGWPSKRWPRENFAKLAIRLAEQTGVKSIVAWAGAEEEAWADQIVTQSRGQAVKAPATNLVELAAFCRHAKLFVGGDTGPLHLAAAVGTRSVALFGAMPALRNGPYGSEHVVIEKACLLGSSRVKRTASNDLMKLIEVSEVFQACEKLLTSQRKAAA